jgi:hypothetical protein
MVLLVITLFIMYYTFRQYQRLHMNPVAVEELQLHPISNHFDPAYPRRHQSSSVQLSQQALEMCSQTLWHTLETTTIVLADGGYFYLYR